jgi:hypothetical protein
MPAGGAWGPLATGSISGLSKMGRPRDPDGLRGIARRLGVSSAAVSKAARTGRIDLSAPVEEITRQWEANTDPAMQAQ